MVELRIDEDTKGAIARACASATRFPLDFVTFTKLAKMKPEVRKRRLPARPDHEVIVPYGYKVAFEIAEVRRDRPCRHLIVRGPDPDRLPEPAAVARIMQEFGYRYSLREVMTWVEKPFTVHVVEPLDV